MYTRRQTCFESWPSPLRRPADARWHPQGRNSVFHPWIHRMQLIWQSCVVLYASRGPHLRQISANESELILHRLLQREHLRPLLVWQRRKLLGRQTDELLQLRPQCWVHIGLGKEWRRLLELHSRRKR